METLSAQNLERLKLLSTSMNKAIEVGNSVLYKYEAKDCDLETYTYLKFIERFIGCLKSINVLFPQFIVDPSFETSIGLIIRSSLSDYVTILFLATHKSDNINNKSDEDGKAKSKEIVEKFLSDNLYHTFTYLKEVREEMIISKTAHQKIVDNLHLSYKYLFKNNEINYDKPENNLIYNRFNSLIKQFKHINSHPLTSNLASAYDLYSHYSKYEHFGIMTQFLQEQGINSDFERILRSIQHIIKGICFCFFNLSYSKREHEIEINSIEIIHNEIQNI